MGKAAVVVMLVLAGLVTMEVGARAQTRQTEHTLGLDDGRTPLPAKLSELDWLVGRWVGTGLGGECEEVFLPPRNDLMTGAFRYARNGPLVFSEFFSFVQTEGGVVLKLRHLHPDFTGWEDKDHSVTFPLVKLEKHAAYFGGLTYQLTDDGMLNVWVAMRNRNTQEIGEVPFEFRRGPLESAPRD